MTRIFLKIYDSLSGRKTLAWTILAAVIAVCAFMISRVHYSEDISAFLPQSKESEKYSSVYEKLGGSRVAVLFRMREDSSGDDGYAGRECIVEAMDRFGELWEEADTAGMIADMQVAVDADDILAVADFIRRNAPYLLEKQDYERIDSLLSDSSYIRERLEMDRQMLMFPSSAFVGPALRYDPLDFFSPLFGRLLSLRAVSSSEMEDSHIFLDGGKIGAVFFNSPFGSSESGKNGELAALLDSVMEKTAEEFGDIRISATGGPLIAVTNASQIKKDSILAVIIASVLIALVLFLAFRDLKDIIWIGTSILCGAVFSMGLIAALKSSVSVIVLGIGSIIIGIAVNYPLHYIDHLKHEPDTRRALRDIVNPLLVGNITTVCAFLSLFLLRAEALHDFGLTGALMLVGTIIFVLVFLPSLMKSGRRRSSRTVNFDFTSRMPQGMWKRLALPFLALTAILSYFSLRTSFDSDMSNINYMTASQREDLSVLAAAASADSSKATIYAVSQGNDLDGALRENERLMDGVAHVVDRNGVTCSSISCIIPSSVRQQENLDMWNGFVRSHPSLAEELAGAAEATGFSRNAFRPFLDMLDAGYEVMPAEHFSPLLESVGKASVLYGDDGINLVNYISVPSEASDDIKSRLQACTSSDSFVFDSRDVGNRLVSLLSDDFDSVGLVCSFIVFFFLWISFGRIELSLLSFLPLAVSWIWILGIMQLLGIKFNIVNIILATFIFGQGDDYTIFITEGLMYEYAYGKKILSSYKNSVALSAIIMFIGIGALIFAEHPAMKSLAHVTVIGMLTVVTMAYFLPPAVFRWMTSSGGKRREMPLTLARLGRTAFAFSAFILAMVAVIPSAWIYSHIGRNTEKKKLRYHKFLQRLSRFSITHVPGVKFSVSNLSGENFSRPAVIVANHQSHLDILCMLMLSPKIVVLTNDWVWNFYRGVIRFADFYPVSNGLERNLELLRLLCAQGYSVLVFPEGTRSEDCSIGRFHRGAFLLAEELRLDIVPVFIHGAGHVLAKNGKVLRKGSISVEIHDRIRPDDLSFGEGFKERTKGIRRYYVGSYERICRERETAGYYADLVRHQYVYKGREIEKECASQLSLRHCDMVGSFMPASGDGIVRIAGSGIGAFALLFAMARKDLEVYACESDLQKLSVARNCVLHPVNLHYVEELSGEADFVL